MKRRGVIVCGSLLAAGLALAGGVHAQPSAQAAGAAREATASGRYIVLYDRTIHDATGATTRRERSQGFRARLRYSSAVKGFAATLTAQQADRLRADAGVASVTEDRIVTASAAVPLAPGDLAPTGVRRIETATATTAREKSSVNVAVIDTGIDLDHPDLDAVDGRNCVTPGAPADDDHGHGTHVAGTIAARNNGSGVVGVAPGTKVVAVKVLNATGSGSMSQVICGIDWVTSTMTDGVAGNDIPVANMSLGASGPPLATCAATGDAMHRAICASTAAGTTYVVAAGNSGWEFDWASSPDVPAAYPQVLTVTALADSDGRPGGLGSSCSSSGDDTTAYFSNYASTVAASDHTIAAPGSCIKSTYLAGGQATMSGTSMASPHVAGAVALCFGEAGAHGHCAGLTPAQIITTLRAEAQSRSTADSGYGFSGDPLRPAGSNYFGHLVAVEALLSAVSLTQPVIGSTTADVTPTFTGGASNVAGDAALVAVDVFAGSTAGGPTVRQLTATRSAGAWSATLPEELALAHGIYTARARQVLSGGDEATSTTHTFMIGSPAAAALPAPAGLSPALSTGVQSATPPPARPAAPAVGAAKAAAELQVRRARVHAKRHTLEVVASISGLATGTISVTFEAGGARTRLRQAIRAGRDSQRFVRRISRAQARSSTGVLTLRYAGNGRTRPQEVRVLTAARGAQLVAQRPRLTAGRLLAAGTVSARARGTVRVQLDWSHDGEGRHHDVSAPISDGRWRLAAALPARVRSDIAGRDGTLHAYVVFSGDARRRIRGEMRSVEVLGAP